MVLAALWLEWRLFPAPHDWCGEVVVRGGWAPLWAVVMSAVGFGREALLCVAEFVVACGGCEGRLTHCLEKT